jgi:hypothetical protein
MSTGGGLISPVLSFLTNTNNLDGRKSFAQLSIFLNRAGELISPELTPLPNTNRKNSGKVMTHFFFCDMAVTPFSIDSR